MKKLSTSVLAVVLSSTFIVANAQEAKKDSVKTTEIEGVVVTALGIKREQKAIGYAAQELKGDIISASRSSNAISSLSGNVAGIQVTSSSASMGGSSRITLRGVSSITGDNRPLIIVDGIPFNNSNFNAANTARGGGGVDYGDASSDINPDDIESVVVLKGGPAAALYGARAINGAIVYTTKRGKGGRTQITLNSGISFDKIYKMPRLQNQYGQGSKSTFNQINIGGQTYNIPEYSVDESWGPKYDANTLHLPWYAFDPEFSNDYMKAVPWVAPNSDVDSFFKTGVTYNNNLSIARSFDRTGIRFSYSNVRTEGIFPNSNLTKNTLNLSVNSQLNDKLKLDASLTYNLNDGFNRPEQGYGDNSVAQKFFQWGARSIDFSKLRDYKLADGTQRGWNRISWNNPTLKYADNPYWTAFENYTTDKRQRFYGNASLTYNILKGFYVVGNLFGDVYSFTNDSRVAIGSQALSQYSISKRNFSEYNYELRAHFDKKFGDFSINSFVGTNMRQSKVDLLVGSTNGGLTIPNFYNLSNSFELPTVSQSSSHKRVYSLYESVSLGYKDIFFVDATNRTDWSSSLPNKPYNYPSISGSIVFSNLLGLEWLNFGKIRGGWANISSDADPYMLANVYDVRLPFLGNPRYSNTDTYRSPYTISENKVTKEIGLETRMFKNRLGLDVTLYDSRVKDQIISLPIDPGTGNTTKVINVGEMSNRGVEVVLNAKVLKSENFSWDVNVNFARNINKLVHLSDDSKNLLLANAPFRVGVYAVEGMKYGQIYGTDYVYDDAGNKIIDSDGYYKATNSAVFLGSYLPEYNGGLRNTFRYKNFTLSALIDRQKGGKYFSTTHMWGMYSGMLNKTADNGIRENGIILPGVISDGAGGYKANDIVLSAQDYAANHYNRVDAANVFDASYWKLREITLGYTLPKKLLGDTISDVTFTAFARNLFTWGLAWDIDPETASYSSGNVQGIEGGSLPSTRTYGINVQFKF